jgi:predicted acylesterase/phospholipase RssA
VAAQARPPSDPVTPPTVGLTLSGGGSRAAAFGLGCLRALHDTGVLDKVTVVSGVSGGSLLAALWAYGPTRFEDFDAATTVLLRRGLQAELFRRVAGPAGLLRSTAAAAGRALPTGRGPRPYNRTDVLRAVLDERAFGGRLMSDPTRPGLSTVLNATDLITSRAVRFGSDNSSCSSHGTIADPITVAEAVAASAAFPLLLPAVERTYTFERGGASRTAKVHLTDGGVYDNLGLSVLQPGRSPDHTRHVYSVDYVVACDAGRQEQGRSRGKVWPLRIWRSFDITYRKTQDGGRARLNAAGASGQLDGFVHAYLGMRDSNLPVPVPDLIPLDRVNGYPTNFAAMSPDDLAAVAGRAEHLTRALLAHYCPGLV